MEINIKYGESYFDKRGEELIKGSKEFKITGKIQDVDNGENKGIIKIIPYDLGFLSLDVGIGRSINNEYGEDWFGYLGTIFY